MKLSRFVLAASIATLLAAPVASAEVYHWQIAGTTNSWSTGAGDTNWFIGSNAVLSPWVNGSDAAFDAATGEAVTVIGTLAPQSTTVGAGGGNWSFLGSGVIGGTLVKEGAGTLSFGTNTGANAYTSANTFTGTTINGGTISLGGGGTAGATSNVNALGAGLVTINSGGTLKLWISNNNAATAPWTLPNNLLVNGGTVLGEDGINAIGGTVEVGANGATFSGKWDGKTLAFTNVISGSGPVTVQRAVGGSGGTNATVIMTAKNTYTGGTTIHSGFLQLGTAVATNAGGVGIIIGDVTVNSTATLRLTNINALGWGAGTKVNTINVNGGTVLHEANGDNGWGVEYHLTGGTLRSTSATGQFAFGGGTSVTTHAAAGSSLIEGRVILREGNANGQVVFHVEDGAALNDLVVNAAVSANVSADGAHGILKTGDGTMVLNGDSSYTGGTVINGGTLALGSGGTLSSSGITVNNGGTFRVNSIGKTLTEIVANNGAKLGLVAQSGATTNVASSVTFAEGGTTSIIPSFAARPEAGQTFDLLTAYSITGGGTVTPVFNSLGATRVTGTTAIVDDSVVRLTITQGAANLIWNNSQANGVWDLNNTANFTNGAANDVFLAADAVTFNDSVGAGDKTISLSGALAPSQITVNNSSGNYTFNSGMLTGAGSLVKSGTSTLTLGGALTYAMTGGITLNQGTLDLGGKTINIGGALDVNGGALNTGTVSASAFRLEAGTISSTLTGAGELTKTGTGTAILSANNSNTGINTVSAGTLQVGAKGAAGALGTGALVVESGATVRFDRNNSYGNVANNISGTGALVFDGVTTSGATQYALTGDNSGFAGTITSLDGRVGATNAAGSRFGSAELIAVGKDVSSGQFWLTGGTFTNNFTLSGLGWLESTGRLGAIRFGGGTVSGNITLAGDTRLNAHGSTGTISGEIKGAYGVEFGGSSSLSTITLSGTNTYTGPTTVNNATLIVNGSLGNTAVKVADANGTIGGKGTLNGSLTLGTSAGGAKIAADATTAGALHVAGAVNVVGATPVGVSITPGAFMTLGAPYTVMTYGSTAATAANFILANPASYRKGIFTVGSTALTVDVGSKAITWTGSAGANWDISTAASWVDNGAGVEKYYQGDSVTFGDAGAGVLTLAAGLTPTSVTVNSSGNYTFNGGAVVSPNPLTKSGTGTLLLNNQNTYTGGAVINGGTLVVDGNQAVNRLQNNAPVTVNNGGTFEVRGVNALPNNANALDITVNEGGTLRVVSGTSAASSIASHAHFRGVTLNGGTIDLSYSGSGSSYDGESFQLGTGGITVAGSVPSKVIMSGGATAAEVGIALAGSRTFLINDVTGSPAVDFLVSAELENGASATGELVKMGAGTMQIAADTSYTGATYINEGTLIISASLNGTSNVTVSEGATLGGSGTIVPGGSGSINVLKDGIIAPGIGGLGTLTIDSLSSGASNVLLLAPDATFVFELNAGLQSDKIALTNGSYGDIAFGGNTINFLDLSSGTLANGRYTLFTADVQDAYSGLTMDAQGFISGGLTIGSGLAAYAGSTLQVVENDIVLNVIPEPASFATLAGGIAMLLGMRRRRQS